MARVAAGSLNKRITFQVKGSGTNSWGQPNDTWQNYVSVHADIRFQTGLSAVRAESQEGGKEISRTSGSIRIRKRDDISADMRITYRGRVFDIAAVLPDETDDQYMDIAFYVGASGG